MTHRVTTQQSITIPSRLATLVPVMLAVWMVGCGAATPSSTEAPTEAPAATEAPTEAATEPLSGTSASTPTSESITGTPPVPVPEALTLRRSVVIYDESGQEIGTGEARLYAPSAIGVSEATKIRLEIASGLIATAIASTPIGSTNTPSAPSITLTPVVIQTLELHEIMGASLQGVDTSHFLINAIPANGLRNVRPDTLTWWEWNLRPTGQEAVGTNALQVLIYYPRTSADGTSFNDEVANLAITVVVEGPTPTPTLPPTGTPSPTPTATATSTPTPTPTPGMLDQISQGLGPLEKIAGAITAIAGAIGVLYGAYRFVTQRGKKKGK